MSFSHTITRKVATGTGSTITKTISKTAGLEANVSESIPANQTNLQLTYTLDVSAVKSFFMVADVAMIVETNSGSSPTNTITLVADQPYEWITGDYATFLLTGDVTALFITNTTAGELEIRCIVDPTP